MGEVQTIVGRISGKVIFEFGVEIVSVMDGESGDDEGHELWIDRRGGTSRHGGRTSRYGLASISETQLGRCASRRCPTHGRQPTGTS